MLHVIHRFAIGGLENGLANLINRMPRSSFRHAIACVEDYSDFRRRLNDESVEVIALHRSSVGVWRIREQLFRICRRMRPAIVHSRGLSGLDALLPSLMAGTKRRVHGEHGWDVADLHGTKWKPIVLRRLHSPLIDRYVTVSKHLRQYLTDKVGIAASRITQIYNGVDTDRFTPAGTSASRGIPAQFAPAGSIVFGTVGRLEPVKNQTALLDAFATLVKRPDGANLRLAIVGDGPLLGELRRRADSLGVAAQTWLPGAVTNVADVLRGFSVFVLPSLAEGISNTILEAMATGLPVVATAVGGNVELVEPGRTGRLFESGDSGGLAGWLSQYADDDSLRAAHGLAARETALTRFSLDGMVEQYRMLYEDLCGG